MSTPASRGSGFKAIISSGLKFIKSSSKSSNKTVKAAGHEIKQEDSKETNKSKLTQIFNYLKNNISSKKPKINFKAGTEQELPGSIRASQLAEKTIVRPEIKIYDDIRRLGGKSEKDPIIYAPLSDFKNLELLNNEESLEGDPNYCKDTAAAEKKLYKGAEGDYVIRPSTDGKLKTLCILNKGLTVKYKIKADEKGFNVIYQGGNTKHFENLGELILHYRLL